MSIDSAPRRLPVSREQGLTAEPDDPRVIRAVEGYLAALERGERPDRAQLLAGLPEIADQLEACLDALEFVRSLAPPLPEEATEPNRGFCLGPSPSTQPLGDFRLVRELGRGGMGIVYEAEQISLGRRVALKVLPQVTLLDPRQLQRFRNEAQAAAQLHHGNIVPVFYVGCERGVHFYAMQYIDGGTLAERIQQRRRIRRKRDDRGDAPAARAAVPPSWQDESVPRPVGDGPPTGSTVAATSTRGSHRHKDSHLQIAQWGVQAAQALEHAHQQGIIHRDIKPSNLLLDLRGNLWVADFGLARLPADAPVTATGDVLGTLRYMSPEQAQGKPALVDHRSDIYSLGATLYELLTLEPAFAGQDRQVLLRQITHDEPRRLRKWDPSIPADLETVVLKAMAKEPADRYPTAQDLAEDLQRFLSDRAIFARRPGPVTHLQKWSRRHLGLLAAALLFLLVALAGLAASTLLIARERAAALRHWRRAEQQRQVASERELTARRHQYVSDMRLAQHLWENAANTREILRELNKHRPEGDQPDLRGFEWYYLHQLCFNSRQILQSTCGEVYYADFSPDGTVLAAASQKGVQFWEFSTGRWLGVIHGHSSEVNAVAYSPDGKWLATASDDHTIKLWDAHTREELATLRGHEGAVLQVQFSPDGNTLVSANREHVAKLWDRATQREIGTFRGRSVTYFPDGNTIASADGQQLVTWDARTLAVRSNVTAHDRLVNCLACSHDGQSLATGSTDGRVKLWNATTGQLQWTFDHGYGDVEWVAFSPDDRLLALAGDTGLLQVVETSSGRLLKTLQGHSGRAWWVGFVPDGQSVVSTARDATVRIWDLQRSQEYRVLKGPVEPVRRLAFSPDGRRLAAADDTGTVWLWDANEQLAASISSPSSPVTDIAFAHRPDLLVTAVGKGKVELWELSSEEPPKSYQLPATGERLSRSPDGLTVACYGGRSSGLWHVERAEFRAFPALIDTKTQSLAFSPDGKLLAIGYKGRLDLFDVQDRRPAIEVRASHSEDTLFQVAFSWDGRWLAVTCPDRTIRAQTLGKAPATERLFAYRAPVTVLAFAPDGRTLAGGLEQGEIQFWNVSNTQELFTLKAYDGPVDALVFSPDGQRLATAGKSLQGNWEVRLWSAPRLPAAGR